MRKIPAKLRTFKRRPKFISKKRWKEGSGSGMWYQHSTTGEWTKWSRKKDLSRGSRKTVGKGTYKHTHDKKKGLTKSGLPKKRRKKRR